MKKNNKGLSLVIAISITLIMGLLALYILEYIIPFSKNTKNIENSVSAYYEADSAVEDALYSMSGQTDLSYEKYDDLVGNKDYSIVMIASGTTLPPSGNGNSEFDNDYNIIRVGEPIQIEIGDGLITNLSNFKVEFRVPDLDSSSLETLSGGTLKIINWQLSGNNDILNANDTQIKSNEVVVGNEIVLGSRNGLILNNSSSSFSGFYNSNCDSSKSCKLKMSVINKLELTDGTSVPYLEWKINAGTSIPLRYRVINTTGKSYGFRKNLNVKVPQQTVNEAFDFTVFQ